MTYSAPELLLVGAAHNLVLGGSAIQGGLNCNRPPDEGTNTYDFVAEW